MVSTLPSPVKPEKWLYSSSDSKLPLPEKLPPAGAAIAEFLLLPPRETCVQAVPSQQQLLDVQEGKKDDHSGDLREKQLPSTLHAALFKPALELQRRRRAQRRPAASGRGMAGPQSAASALLCCADELVDTAATAQGARDAPHLPTRRPPSAPCPKPRPRQVRRGPG